MRNLFLGLPCLFLATSLAASSPDHPKQAPAWSKLIATVHDNGYKEGYLAGYQASGGDERLRECNNDLLLEMHRAGDAERYEACLKNLKAALFGPDPYVRSVAMDCAAEVH